MQNGDEASPSIILAGRAHLMKMNHFFIFFFFIFFNTYVVKHCPATGMQNGDEASLSIILAGRALLKEMFITL